MTSEKLLSRHFLRNGLTLEVWDRSRAVAGDRWLVALEGRITIPINDSTLPVDLRSQAAVIGAALGPEIVFSQRDERNFIAAAEVAEMLQDMENRLRELAAKYLGHPDFPGRFIRRKYAEYQERRRRHQS